MILRWRKLNAEYKVKTDKRRATWNDPENQEKRRKIREVQTALDGRCSLHRRAHIDGRIKEGKCIDCEWLKQKKNLPNEYHRLEYADQSWHDPNTCNECQRLGLAKEQPKPKPKKISGLTKFLENQETFIKELLK